MDDYLVGEVASHITREMNALGFASGKPIMLVGSTATNRSTVLARAAELGRTKVCNVGTDLTSAILEKTDQPFVTDRPSATLDGILPGDPKNAFLDHVEVLCSTSLNSNAIEVLSQLARRRAVCVNWPGRVENGRIRYAAYGHPEYLDEDAMRVLIVDISKIER